MKKEANLLHSQYDTVAVDILADINAAYFIKRDVLLCFIICLNLLTNDISPAYSCFSTEVLVLWTNALLPPCWEACLVDVAHLNYYLAYVII